MSVIVRVMPALLAVTAEAAWISILAGLLQAFSAREPRLGIPALFIAALVGLVAARTLGVRLGHRWPAVAAVLTIGMGAIGWLAAPEVRSGLGVRGADGLLDALAANPAGFLVGLAFVRGVSHARIAPDPGRMAGLLAVGVPGLAIAVLAGGMTAQPWQARFLGDAQGSVLVFLVCGLLALALGRLTVVDARPGLDWRRNPAWIGLLVMLLLAVAAVALWMSLVAGPAVLTLIGALVPIVLVMGILVGFDRWSLRVFATAIVVIGVIVVMLGALGAQPPPQNQDTGTAVDTVRNLDAPTPVVVAGLAVILLIVAIVVIVLVRIWMRGGQASDEDELETRWIDHGDDSAARVDRRGPRRRRWFPRPAPTDAVAAYRALLEDLERRPPVRRAPAETPAEHAARLRREGTGALALDLLAADYGLVRFGGMTLSPAEDRRAITRAHRLRASLTGEGPSHRGPGTGPVATG